MSRRRFTLQLGDPRPRKRFAMFPETRSQICDHPLGFPYSGEIPCTGPRLCPLCGTDELDATQP